MSRSEISKKLGQKEVSGQLKKVFRDSLTDGVIEYTLPEKTQESTAAVSIDRKRENCLGELEVRKLD